MVMLYPVKESASPLIDGVTRARRWACRYRRAAHTPGQTRLFLGRSLVLASALAHVSAASNSASISSLPFIDGAGEVARDVR